MLKKIYTRWWQEFKQKPNYKHSVLWIGLLLLFSSLSAQDYPDFRRACALSDGQNVRLSWSPLDADPCNGFQNITIYGRTDNFQPYQEIDVLTDINALQYTHFGAQNISNNWSYQIVYKFLCNGDSSSSHVLQIDLTQPQNMFVDSVSVNIFTNDVTIGWSENTAPDLYGYFVWQEQGANNVFLDTTDTTFFVHPESSPQLGAVGYTVTAIDSCFNQSEIQTGHRTIFLQSTYNRCLNTIDINWSAYVGWSNILNYKVFSRNGIVGGFTEVANNNPSQRNLSFSNFTAGDTLEFYIQATDGNNGYTSTSNKITVITRLKQFSARNYFSFATVIDSFSIGLKFLADPASDAKKFILFRKNAQEAFRKITEFTYDGVAQDITYTDFDVNPMRESYEYRVISEDTCQNNLDTTNLARSIHLSITSNDNGNALLWNRYENWDAGVNGYSVFRGFDFGDGFTWNSIATINNTDSSFLDNQLPADVGIAGTCYYIEANENLGNSFGEQATSKSNTVCLLEDAIIHFPNAFAPKKVNTLFLPKGVNIDYSRTTMLIYARNGQLMKKIDDIRQGWDGTNLNGELCLDGVYLYICELFGLNEKKYNYKGTLHLLR